MIRHYIIMSRAYNKIERVSPNGLALVFTRFTG